MIKISLGLQENLLSLKYVTLGCWTGRMYKQINNELFIPLFRRFGVGMCALALVLYLTSCMSGYADEGLSLVGLDAVEGSVPVNSTSDVFLPLLEDEISTLAAALGEGPYTIGKPLQGYASDSIKEAFAIYDFDTKFTEFSNQDSEVCDFTKVALFSDEIDLSEFYWNHPDVSDAPIKKLDQHTYHLNDDLELVVHFNYHDYRVDRTLSGRAIHRSFNNPILHLCDFGSNYVWKDFGVGYLTLRKNLKKVVVAVPTSTSWMMNLFFRKMCPVLQLGFSYIKTTST